MRTEREIRGLTIGAPLVREMLEGAILAGHDAAEILRAHKISPKILSNPKLRVPLVKYAALGSGIVRLLDDEGRGMLVRPMKRGTMATIYRACFSAENVEQSLATWAEACNAMAHAISFELQSESDTIAMVMECEKNPQVAGNTVANTQLVGIHRFHCWLAKEHIPVVQVEYRKPEPAHAFEYHFAFYGAPVLFNRQRDAITFDRKYLNLEIHRERAEIAQWVLQPISQSITQRRLSTSPSVKVRRLIENKLHQDGTPMMLEEAAEHMGLTPQTLRRRLKKNGMSFHQIKEDTRRDMAINLLSAGKLRVEEVAFRAGFSEASTFCRAFKNWTGMTPLAYRRMEDHAQ